MTFMCKISRTFFLLDKVCNKIYDCPDGSDELYCNFSNNFQHCISKNVKSLHCLERIDSKFFYTKNNWKHLVLQNYSSVQSELFLVNYHVVTLAVKNTSNNNSIDAIQKFGNLIKLNLSRNCLDKFLSSYLKNKLLLQNLDLSYNRITILTNKSFSNLHNLLVLNVSYNSFTYLKKDVFSTLKSLKELIIKSRKKINLDENIFYKLNKLKILYLKFKTKNKLKSEEIINLISLNEIHLNQYEVCCMLKYLRKQVSCYFYGDYRLKIRLNNLFTVTLKIAYFFLSLYVFLSIFIETMLIWKFKVKLTTFKMIDVLLDTFIFIYLIFVYYLYTLSTDEDKYDTEFFNLFCLINNIQFSSFLFISSAANIFKQWKIMEICQKRILNDKINIKYFIAFSVLLVIQIYLYIYFIPGECIILFFHPKYFSTDSFHYIKIVSIIFIFIFSILSVFLYLFEMSKIVLKNFTYLHLKFLSTLLFNIILISSGKEKKLNFKFFNQDIFFIALFLLKFSVSVTFLSWTQFIVFPINNLNISFINDVRYTVEYIKQYQSNKKKLRERINKEKFLYPGKHLILIMNTTN